MEKGGGVGITGAGACEIGSQLSPLALACPKEHSLQPSPASPQPPKQVEFRSY